MVATVLSLKLHLTVAELKRSVARLILWIFLALYALGVVAMILMGLAAASLVVPGNEALIGAITIIVGSLVVAGWSLLPLLFFGFDQTLDPARFTQFPLTGRQLAPALVLAGVVGLPGFITAVVCLGSALTWMRTPLVAVVALLGGVLGFLMTQVGCRALSTTLSGTLSSRKARDLTGVIGLVVILLLSMSGYVISMAGALFSTDPGRLSQVLAASGRVSQVLSWTPLGAPWALVGDAAQGQWALLVAHLVLTLAYLGLGLWLYAAVLGKALITPPHAGSVGVVAKGDTIARAANWTWAVGRLRPVAAIMARCLRYWRRDPRYLGQIPAVLMMPILFTIIGQTMPRGNVPDALPPIFAVIMIGFGLGFMALMAGYTLSADVASDSTAWWVHLATGVAGWQDRLGRVLAQLVWAGPLIVIVGVAVPWATGHLPRVPAVLGAMTALYLPALGVSSLFSALIIYPVALPGESPLKMRTGMMGSQMLSQMGCLTVSGLLGLPIAIWAIFATGWQGWLVLLIALVWGFGLLALGIHLGGKTMDARGPAILATLNKNDSRERG